MSEEKKEYKTGAIFIDKELLNEIREHAETKGHNIKWVATTAIREYLDKMKIVAIVVLILSMFGCAHKERAEKIEASACASGHCRQ